VVLLFLVGRTKGQPYEWEVIWDDSLRALLSLFAGLACLGRSRHPREPYARPWRAFAWAHLSHATATAYLVGVLDLLHLSGAVGGLRHLGYTLSLLFLGQGVLAWPVAHRLPTQRLQTALDGLMVGGSALFLAWGLLLRDLVLRQPELSTPYVFTLVYPILAIAAGTAWFFQETRAVMGYFRGPLNLLRLGLALAVLCQALYAALSIHGAYRSNLGTRLDILFGASTLCFGLAALWPRSKAGPVRMPQAPPFLVGRLVYVPVLAALAYGAARISLGRPADPVLAWTGCVLGFLLCVREYLALRDLSSLSETLEDRVEARTEALRRSQAELLRAQRVQAIAAMAAGLSHDLKNLFAVIQSWAALVRMEQGASAHEGIAVIEETAARGHRMVQEMLAVGRQVPMQPQALDIAAFLSDLPALLRGGPGLHHRPAP
jgi:signal transduction histidine kinase